MPSYHIYFIALNFPLQQWLWLLGHNAFPKLGSHLMGVGYSQVQFLGNLLIGEIQPHEIQAQNPNPQGLMMASENRAGQIVKTLPAVLALVPTTLGLGIVSALPGDALQTAFRAGYSLRPSYFTDFLVALGVIDQILDIHDESSIRLGESDRAVGLIYPISLGAVNTSLKPQLSLENYLV